MASKWKRLIALALVLTMSMSMCLEGAYAADEPVDKEEPESQVTTEETAEESQESSEDASAEEVQEEEGDSGAAEDALDGEEESEESAVPALAYLVVSQPELTTPDTQQILVGIGSEEVVLDAATITVYNENTGVYSDYAASSLTGGAALFEIEYSDDDSGAYTLSSVCYTYEEVETQLDLDEIGVSARYGVNMEVDTDPDDVVVTEDQTDSEETCADVELEVSTINEDGELELVDSIEEALTIADEEESGESGIMALALDDDDDDNESDAFGIMALALDDDDDDDSSTIQNDNIVVVLDAGHDSTHAGATGNGLHEEVLTLKIAQYCQAELEEYSGVTVYMTRSTSACPFPGTTPADDNSNRVVYAASVGADYYVAIHLNSYTSSTKGAEVYYPNANYATSATNSSVDSGVNLNEVGEDLAQSIMDQLVSLGLTNHGLRTRSSEDGSKYADGSLADYYAVIRGSKRRGICGLIIEHCYITNYSDAKNYLSSEYSLKKLGIADATGIANYLGLTKGPNLPIATISDGVYEITTSVNSNYTLDISNASTSDKANAQAYKRNSTLAQKFQITSVGGGYYKIVNVKSGKVLDIANGSSAAGTNVWQYTWNGSDAQLWRFLDAGDGTYYLQSKLGTVLSLASSTVSNGTNVQTGKISYSANQRWSLVSTSVSLSTVTIENGVYEICSGVNGNFAVDISNAGTANKSNAQAYKRNSTLAQKFEITSVGDGYYKIVNVKSGKVLDVANASAKSGANVWQYTWNGTDAQLWKFLDAGNGTYYLQSKLGTVLSLSAATVANGTNVQTGTINYSTAQRWKLVSTSVSLSTATVADGVYEISSGVNSSYALDISGASTADEANAQAYKWSSAVEQQFQVTSVGDGYYKIANVKSGKVLEVAEGSAVAGTNAWQNTWIGTDAQLWKFLDAGDGSYYLQSKLGMVLSLETETVSNGTNVQTGTLNYGAAQRWSLVSTTVSLTSVTIEDGVYEITTSANSNYTLDISGGSTSNKANVQGYKRNNTMAQRFQITSVGDGYYKIINVKSGKVLDVADGSAKSGANVWQYGWNGTDAQLWKILDAGDGTYYLQSKLGTVLSLSSGSVSNGTNVQTGTINYSTAQRWNLVSAPLSVVTITDGVYEICTSVNSNYVVDISNAGTANKANAQAYKRNNTEAQQFEITSVGDGYYKILNVKSGKVLDVANGSAKSGANVWQYTWNGSDAQLWRFLDAGDGTYYLQSKLGTVLSLASTTVSNGTNVQAGEITYGTAQRWSLNIALTARSATINDNSEAIWSYLVNEAGLTKAGAAGLMGNLDAESGLDPKNLEGRFESLLYYTVTDENGDAVLDENGEEQVIYYTDETYTAAVDDGSYRYGDYDNAGESFAHDYVGSTSGKLGAGYGLAQWTWYSYKQGLYDYAQEKGTSVGDLQTQLEFLVNQLKTEFNSSVWKVLTTTDDVLEAYNAVLLNFERPADQSLTVQYKRAGKGLTYYNTYA
jgi:N-acetylmuramoyl-L-alanine amidase